MIDWHDMFKRYVAHVSETEGAHFLEGMHVNAEERAALDEIMNAEEATWYKGDNGLEEEPFGNAPLSLLRAPLIKALKEKK